jgi:hypothetical protein
MKTENVKFAETLLSILPKDIQSDLLDLLAVQKPKQFSVFTDIKTFDDACVACGTSEKEFYLKFSDMLLDADTFAYEQLKIVVRAINQGWYPNWNDGNQRKWYPYFNLSSGFGFSDSLYGCEYANTSSGSRFCFETEDKASYAGQQFLAIYKEVIL